MPEEQPLETFVSFEFVFKAKLVFAVELFEQVEKLGAGFHYGKRRGLGVID